MFKHIESHNGVERPLEGNRRAGSDQQSCIRKAPTGAINGILAEVHSESRPTGSELIEKLSEGASPVRECMVDAAMESIRDKAPVEFHLPRWVCYSY